MLRCEPGQIDQRALPFTLKPQAYNFSLWLCKTLWSVRTFTNFFSKHYYINEIHSKSFELSDQNFMLFFLPLEHMDFLHCYNTNSHSMPLHLVLMKSKLDKAVITYFYLWFLDSFSSGSVIIWQVNMKLLRFIFKISYLISDNVPTEPEGVLLLILLDPWAYSSLYLCTTLANSQFCSCIASSYAKLFTLQ